MTDRLILTVTATQGPEGAACLAWQLSHGGVRAMGLAHTLLQVLGDFRFYLRDCGETR